MGLVGVGEVAVLSEVEKRKRDARRMERSEFALVVEVA